jgi:hypothetical protein
MPEPVKAGSKKGRPRCAGKRKFKIAAYYELRYPERKLRRMYHHGASIAQLRAWADAYKTPSGVSGIHALIKVGKAFNLNLNQAQ